MADLNRRCLLLGASAIFAGGGAATRAATAGEPSRAWDFRFTSIEDGTLDLAPLRGRVLLVVNTASFCGYAYQFGKLEGLNAGMQSRGLTVIGVPSQDFGQEADSNAKAKAFCEATFDVQFPMAGLTHVRGAQAHPFYGWVKAERGWEPGWNFNKVLIGRDGSIRATYAATDEPDGATMQAAIMAEVARAAV